MSDRGLSCLSECSSGVVLIGSRVLSDWRDLCAVGCKSPASTHCLIQLWYGVVGEGHKSILHPRATGRGGREIFKVEMSDKKKSEKKKEGKKSKPKGGVKSKDDSMPFARAQTIKYRQMFGDIRNHEITWLAGHVYVGNGTLGANDTLYLKVPAATPTVSTGVTPIIPEDSSFGSTSLKDIIQHFARIRYHRLKMTMHTEGAGSSTTTPISVTVAPLRGMAGIYGLKTDTTAATYTADQVSSMQGARQIPVYLPKEEIDLTPYIAGGSGPKQNEFPVDVNEYVASGEVGVGVPAAFVLAGNNQSNTTFRGLNLMAIFMSATVDLLDYVGDVKATLVPKRSTVTSATQTQAVVNRTAVQNPVRIEVKDQKYFGNAVGQPWGGFTAGDGSTAAILQPSGTAAGATAGLQPAGVDVYPKKTMFVVTQPTQPGGGAGDDPSGLTQPFGTDTSFVSVPSPVKRPRTAPTKG